MRFRITLAVEGTFSMINSDPYTASRITRSYEVNVISEVEAELLAMMLKDNLVEEANLIGEIDMEYQPLIEELE